MGALIEARSCERFRLLAAATEDETLRTLWNELLASEARHYRTFVDLAVRAAGVERETESPRRSRDRVIARLDQLAIVEGAIVTGLAERGASSVRASIHG